jgi:hypothetical protein
MKQTYKLVLVLAAGAAIGVAGGNAIRAQQVKVAPGYVVAELEVNDPTTFHYFASQTLIAMATIPTSTPAMLANPAITAPRNANPARSVRN